MARLTDAQKQKLPVELRIVIERFVHDPHLLMQLKHTLAKDGQKIMQQSINHETFCNTFQVPDRLPNELLALYGMSERQLSDAMAKIGFILNDMYKRSYYQTLCVAYLIGLEFDDENIRKLAILLIVIRIWNGRKIKFFPRFCDPDIARYVLNYVLKGTHSIKKVGSVFEYLDRYLTPQIDFKYAPTIANNLDSHTEGLRKLIETNYSRIVQTFSSMARAYYKTQAEGKKEIISGQYQNQYGSGDTVEMHESFSGNIERLVDKIVKNAMLKKNILLTNDAKNIFKEKFNISDASIKKLNDWIDDNDNEEEIKYFFELLFTNLKTKDEADVCKYDLSVLANKVTTSKKDEQLKKAKEILDHALISILGGKYQTMGIQSQYRLRAIMSYALIIFAKIMLCKKL